MRLSYLATATAATGLMAQPALAADGPFFSLANTDSRETGSRGLKRPRERARVY